MAVPPKRSGSPFDSAVNSRATASGVAPGAIRATSGRPNRPGVMPSGRMAVGIHSRVPSLGNLKSGPMTPITVRCAPAM